MRTLPPSELISHLHPVLPSPENYRVVRYEFNFDFDSGLLIEIGITLRSTSGQALGLSFENPSLAEYGPLQLPEMMVGRSIYIADLKEFGWDSLARVEVGGWGEDKPPFFWSSNVTVHA